MLISSFFYFLHMTEIAREKSDEKKNGDLTWEVTIEWLFSGMASHMSFECIATCMFFTFSTAPDPFTCIYACGLEVLDVDIVNVFDKFVHVAEIACWAAVPGACCDLFEEVVFNIKAAGHYVLGARRYASRCV